MISPNLILAATGIHGLIAEHAGTQWTVFKVNSGLVYTKLK